MINIGYNKNGKVQTIHIKINNCWANIPWNSATKTIDWNEVTYQPTRDSIQSAWNAWANGKDLSIELKDRPDLAPISPKPKPDWGGFNIELISQPAYIFLMSQVAGFMAANLSVTAAQLAAGNSGDYQLTKTLWNQIIDTAPNKLNSTQINSLNQLASKYSLPLSFDSDGKLHDQIIRNS